MAIKRVKVELMATNGRIPIDAFSEIDGLAGQIYTMLMGNIYHHYPLKNARNNSSKRSVQM